MRPAPIRMGEAMKRSGLSRKMLRRFCESGVLSATKLDNGRGDWLIDQEALEVMIRPGSDDVALEIVRGLGL